VDYKSETPWPSLMIALLSKSMLMAIICPSCRHRGTVPDNVLPRDLKCSQCGKWHWFQKGKRLSTGFALARAAAERELADEIAGEIPS
jgi:ribosomal protein S27E